MQEPKSYDKNERLNNNNQSIQSSTPLSVGKIRSPEPQFNAGPGLISGKQILSKNRASRIHMDTAAFQAASCQEENTLKPELRHGFLGKQNGNDV
jgi:hypothetical protein